jgi:SHS family lactate transporter-like MFS transporter
VEYALRDHLGYAWALTSFEITVILLLTVVLVFGQEKRGRSFKRPDEVIAA